MHIIPRLILSQIHAVKGHMEYVCAISFDVKYRIARKYIYNLGLRRVKRIILMLSN